MKTKISIKLSPTGLTQLDCDEVNINEIALIPDSHCDEINVSTALDFTQNRTGVLEVLVKKLKYNGVIIISGLDILLLNHNLFNLNLSISDVNRMLYQVVDGHPRCSVSTIQNLVDTLTHYGLTILDKHINHDANQFLIKARRNVS